MASNLAPKYSKKRKAKATVDRPSTAASARSSSSAAVQTRFMEELLENRCPNGHVRSFRARFLCCVVRLPRAVLMPLCCLIDRPTESTRNVGKPREALDRYATLPSLCSPRECPEEKAKVKGGLWRCTNSLARLDAAGNHAESSVRPTLQL
jgi:hypothetical protein